MRARAGVLYGRVPRLRFILVAGLLAVSAMFLAKSNAQDLGQRSRVVQGRVLDPAGQPQPNAIVYLQNEKTLEIKTYITVADGSYRFGQLSSDVDYQLWAKYRDSRSKTKSISSFDSKKQFYFDLKLEPKK